MERGDFSANRRTPVIMTNDPSLTAWGWCIINHRGRILNAGCIKTESESKKRRIRKGDDTVRRISEINNQLKQIIKTHDVQFIVSELPHGSQTAAGAKMLGIVAGILQTFSDLWDLPIEWYSEADAKKAVLNKQACTKEEMIAAIDKLYEVPWVKAKYVNEAIADSMAIFHVARLQSSTIKMLIR